MVLSLLVEDNEGKKMKLWVLMQTKPVYCPLWNVTGRARIPVDKTGLGVVHIPLTVYLDLPHFQNVINEQFFFSSRTVRVVLV